VPNIREVILFPALRAEERVTETSSEPGPREPGS